MVGLPLAYQFAKRASAASFPGLYCIQYRTLYSSSLRKSNSTNFSDKKCDGKDHREVENVSTNSQAAVSFTKTKKRYSELPKFRVLRDGSIAKPLEEWHGGEDTPSMRSVDLAFSTADDLLRTTKGHQDLSEDMTKESEEHKEIDADGVALKKRPRKKKDAEPVEQKKRIRREKLDDTGEKKLKRAAKPKTAEDDSGGLPKSALAQEIRDNLSKFPHCLLLTRVGNFYESYFDQAIEISKILNIKLTSRRWGGGRVPMCGFPLLHIDKHLKVMVQQHKRFVAMCEEFPRSTLVGEREFERRVVRVITPGTLIDESFLNQYENNYLLAINIPLEGDAYKESTTGLAWIDVSTGEFYSKRSSRESLRDDITRIGPQEIVLHKGWETQATYPAMEAIAEESNVVSFVVPSQSDVAVAGNLSSSSSTFSVSNDTVKVANVPDEIVASQDASPSAPLVYTQEEASAIDLLTTYLRANLLEHMPPLSLPNREDSGDRMQIDSHTIKALEIRESMQEGSVRGSLMSSIKRTVTTSGTRLLARWLCSPSASIQEINARQSLVAFFHVRPHFRADLLLLLAKAEDAGRIVQKFLLGKGDPNDMLALTATVDIWNNIRRRVAHEREMESHEQKNVNPNEWAGLETLMNRMENLEDLAKRISLAVEKPTSSHGVESDLSLETNEEEGDMDASPLRSEWRYGRLKFGIKIKPEFSPTLLDLNKRLQDLWDRKAEMEEKLQLKYDALSLTLRSSPGQGMHVHLGKSKRDQRKLNADPAFVSINESGSTRSYFYQEWSQLGQQIYTTSIAVLVAEKEAFETLRQEVNLHAPSLRRNTRILDELDVTLAFARLAVDMNLVRPTMREDTSYNVINGRHPTVELGLLTSGRVFTPNTVVLTPSSNFHVITGPNMAGKSTFLRQTALIAILAQSGSFVPADTASLGIVDKLFSRVGAKDDLFHDRSTFMVEMLETAEILRRATPRSLVIMDEVGRGTTVKDGIALAFATIHHLISVNRCRTLFATHFHELSDILGYRGHTPSGEGVFSNVSFFCTAVDEMEDGSFSYSYRLRPGVNRDSHGLKVAQLAGMPQSAVNVAQNVLTALKDRPAEELDANELIV